MRLTNPVTCPYCHEPYVMPHDERRCKTIARAWAIEATDIEDEISYQIVSLVCWLRDHPAERTARQIAARQARRDFLDHYIQLAEQ